MIISFWLPVVASIIALTVIAAVTINLWAISLLYLMRLAQLRHLAVEHQELNVFPDVLVQLPVYNEMLVVERVIAAACALDWPQAALHIQVLDDSTDETQAVAQAVVARYRAAGYQIEYCHRTVRSGYKAGALKAGLVQNNAPYVAMFDADFVPAPNFLQQIMPALLQTPRAAFAQARWGASECRRKPADQGAIHAARCAFRDRADGAGAQRVDPAV